MSIPLCVLGGTHLLHVSCLSLSGFDEVSVVVFEARASLTEKAEQERKGFQNVYIVVGLTAGSQNVKEREKVCAVSVSEIVKESVLSL